MSDTASSSAAPRSTSGVDPGAVVVLLFFVSGTSGLLYEVAFIRSFVALYGSTSAALGAVVAAFLASLAIGALAVVRLADRTPRPLRLYALLEAVAAAGGLLAALALPRLEPLAVALARSSPGGLGGNAIRFAVSLGVMLVPAGALGATLPVLARFRASERHRGLAAGALQVANTLGAMTGALLAALVGLPLLGMQATVQGAALLNGAIAVVAALLARGAAASGARAPSEITARVGAPEESVAWSPFLLASLLGGLVVVGVEVLLFRGLAQVSRGGVDSLAVVLATFLGAHSLGGAIGIPWSRTPGGARTGFVAGQLLAAVGILWGLNLLYELASPAPWSVLMRAREALDYPGRLAREAVAALLVVGPAAFGTGVAFPCVCRLRPRLPVGLGGWVALLSFTWTIGAVIGGLVVPESILPRLGLRGGLLAAATLPLVALIAVFAAERSRLLSRAVLGWLGGAAVMVGVLLLGLPVSGSPLRQELRFFRFGAPAGSRLLEGSYQEGPIAHVAVVELPGGARQLKVNNHFSLGGSATLGVEALQALLPVMLAERAEQTLVLGVGAGSTLRALRRLGVPRVEAVELVPEVLDSLLFFETLDGTLLGDEGVGLIADDARNLVRIAREESYDLIVGDLFFPWQPEAGFLYTREHFERIRRLLKPGGVFCQWLPGHQLRWEEIGLIGRTFSEVFEGATLWLARPEFEMPVLALIAGRDGLRLDVEEIDARMADPRRRDLLERLGVTDAGRLLSLYVGDEWFFRTHFEDTESINTLDRPLVEYLAARAIETEGVLSINNRRRLARSRDAVGSRIWTGNLELKEHIPLRRELKRVADGAWSIFEAVTLRMAAFANRSLPPGQRLEDPELLEVEAFKLLGQTLVSDPGDRVALDEIVRILQGQLQLAERSPQAGIERFEGVVVAVATLEESLEGPVPARLLNLRGTARFLAACRDAEQATTLRERALVDFRAALEQDPTLVEAVLHGGLTAFLLERDVEALELLREARSRIRAPARTEGRRLPLAFEATYRFLEGEVDEARRILQRAPPELSYLAALAARIR